MVEIALLHVEVDIKSLSIIIFWLPPKSLSPLCVADESVKENILGTYVCRLENPYYQFSLLKDTCTDISLYYQQHSKRKG